MSTDRLQTLLDEAARDGLFTHARAEVRLHGELAFAGGVGPEGALFDLASITKILSATTIFVSLWNRQVLDPGTPLARFFPDAPVAQSNVNVADLLAHRSGLPAFRPFFAEPMRRWPELLEAHSFANTRALARAVVVQSAIETPLERPRHAEAIYSDVGFILLGELLTLVGGATLDDLFKEHVVTPLGLTAHYRPVSARNPGDAPIAPTGRLRPREPAPGQTSDWSDVVPRPSPAGEVDDDNAWAMDGVSGHAGVFATTADVARFGVAVLEELGGAQRIAPAQLWERMVAPEPFPPGTTRALGFDTPSRSGSSAGERIGKLLPGAFGHTGFTGTSLWVDRPRDLVVALCTNRTVNGRADTRIQQLRPRFHDAVVEVLGL